ncbi:Serine/threonine-protein kinase DCLK1 [Labeo rohita]|uniref:Serine/threonine-protein kinase DCLK1 n=1 Tax=Labeo rohita TaxID=84645 RepID=A0ABQ8M0F1_LABRO|nr:Serine/threonine-protein kinase DCLK1 [Labeo rohita]
MWSESKPACQISSDQTSECRVVKSQSYGRISSMQGRCSPRSGGPSRRSKSPGSSSSGKHQAFIRSGFHHSVERHAIERRVKNNNKNRTIIVLQLRPVPQNLYSGQKAAYDQPADTHYIHPLLLSRSHSYSHCLTVTMSAGGIAVCSGSLLHSLAGRTNGFVQQIRKANGTAGSQLSTPRSGKSPSPSPTSPASLRRRRHSGSSLSLASTKVCSSMDEGDGPGSEAELMEDCPQVPASIAERYKVGRMIGDGNFAVVRECVERSTGREYALKIINKSKCRGKGGDLFDAITSSNKYTERDASGMLYNLASAIKYLHSLNIVHRDIKPENLLVYEHQDGSKSLKLGDFGLATIVDGPLYTICGTPTYVAPEIVAETGYGLKVDIWAAGVITYILLCGFPPFRGSTDDQEALFDQILMGQLDFPLPYWDNVSDSAKALITCMLQVEVEQRYTALQVLDHPWVNDDRMCENQHQLSVAGKIKKNFNMGPKPTNTTAGVTVIASTPLDKERQVFRRRRHQDVKAATARSTQSPFPSSPATGPVLSAAEFTSESEDISPSSAETVRSPTSPF